MINPYAILAVVCAFGLVLAAAGVQTYRLAGAQHEIEKYEIDAETRRENEQHRQRANTSNATRTNDETRNARSRAAATVVRVEFPARPTSETTAPGRSDQETICRTRRELDEAVAGWAERESQRLTAVARAGEEVAAWGRGCVTYLENLE